MRNKLYYRLEEVAEDWGCEIEDLFYQARHEGLRLSLYVENVTVNVHKQTKWLDQLGELIATGPVADTLFDLPGRAMIDIRSQGFCQGVVIPDDDKGLFCDSDGGQVVHGTIPVLLDFGAHKFRLNDIVIIKENLAKFPKPEQASDVAIASCAFLDEGEWEDVHIRLKSLLEAEITVCRGVRENGRIGTYKNFGFENKTTGEPNREWKTLIVMAQYDGNPNIAEVNRGHVSDLKKKLKLLFPNIKGEPFKKYTGGSGWRFNLQLTPHEYLQNQYYPKPRL